MFTLREIKHIPALFACRSCPPEKLRRIQEQRLRATINHACTNVPYYRKLFAGAGISPKNIRTIEDLARIPITTKKDLRNAGLTDMLATGTNIRSCRAMTTSGTTGEPFTTYLSRSDWGIRRMMEFRALISLGLRPSDRLALLGPARPHIARLHQRLGLYRGININPFLDFEEQLAILKKFQPTILWAYPTILTALLHKSGYTLRKYIKPRYLITSAEVTTPFLKNAVQQDLKVPMFNFYGAVETGRIAAECREHSGLHVNTDHVILEEINGEAVVTTLNMRAMPFIRYRLGDIISFKKERCPCGSSLPLIEPPLGRQEDMARLPDNTLVSPFLFMFIFREFPQLAQFRLIQETLDHFVLQIAWRHKEDGETIASITKRFLACVRQPVKLDVESVSYIEPETLKFRMFISKLTEKENAA